MCLRLQDPLCQRNFGHSYLLAVQRTLETSKSRGRENPTQSKRSERSNALPLFGFLTKVAFTSDGISAEQQTGVRARELESYSGRTHQRKPPDSVLSAVACLADGWA